MIQIKSLCRNFEPGEEWIAVSVSHRSARHRQHEPHQLRHRECQRYRGSAGRARNRPRHRRRQRARELHAQRHARVHELEHAAAILHPKLGTPVRRVLGKGAALIPSSKKRGACGLSLDIPLGHKDAAFVRSHFDGMEVRINDAPRANEILVAIAVTDSGRPLPRVGGLTKSQIKGEDGLR